MELRKRRNEISYVEPAVDISTKRNFKTVRGKELLSWPQKKKNRRRLKRRNDASGSTNTSNDIQEGSLLDSSAQEIDDLASFDVTLSVWVENQKSSKPSHAKPSIDTSSGKDSETAPDNVAFSWPLTKKKNRRKQKRRNDALDTNGTQEGTSLLENFSQERERCLLPVDNLCLKMVPKIVKLNTQMDFSQEKNKGKDNKEYNAQSNADLSLSQEKSREKEQRKKCSALLSLPHNKKRNRKKQKNRHTKKDNMSIVSGDNYSDSSIISKSKELPMVNSLISEKSSCFLKSSDTIKEHEDNTAVGVISNENFMIFTEGLQLKTYCRKRRKISESLGNRLDPIEEESTSSPRQVVQSSLTRETNFSCAGEGGDNVSFAEAIFEESSVNHSYGKLAYEKSKNPMEVEIVNEESYPSVLNVVEEHFQLESEGKLVKIQTVVETGVHVEKNPMSCQEKIYERFSCDSLSRYLEQKNVHTVESKKAMDVEIRNEKSYVKDESIPVKEYFEPENRDKVDKIQAATQNGVHVEKNLDESTMSCQEKISDELSGCDTSIKHLERENADLEESKKAMEKKVGDDKCFVKDVSVLNVAEEHFEPENSGQLDNTQAAAQNGGYVEKLLDVSTTLCQEKVFDEPSGCDASSRHLEPKIVDIEENKKTMEVDIGDDKNLVKEVSVINTAEVHFEPENTGKLDKFQTAEQDGVHAEVFLDESTTSCQEKTSDEPSGCDTSSKNSEPKNIHREMKVEEIIPSLSNLGAVKNDTDLVLINNDANHAQSLDPSPERCLISRPKKKLLILDVNGLLADVVAYVPDGHKPDTTISNKAVFKRPFCEDFLKFCFERFHVGVWSSRTQRNVDMVVDFLMGDSKQKLLFSWNQFHCTDTGFNTIENPDKPLVLKELKKLWEKREPNLPWEKGEFNESNTLLLDDSPYKALRNPPHTAIFPRTYEYKNMNDCSLGEGGDLRVYLEGLAEAENVQRYVEKNPFGQRAITERNLSWKFYSRVIFSDRRRWY